MKTKGKKPLPLPSPPVEKLLSHPKHQMWESSSEEDVVATIEATPDIDGLIAFDVKILSGHIVEVVSVEKLSEKTHSGDVPKVEPDELAVSLAFDYCDRHEQWPDNTPSIDDYLSRLPEIAHPRFLKLVNMHLLLRNVEGHRI